MSPIFQRFFGNGDDDRETATPPSSTIRNNGVHWINTTPVTPADKPCTIRSLEVNASIRGVFATVEQTLTIANPNNRPLSTNLTIPLPDAAVVCGYALDINGVMVDGVVVPKEQARVVFETEQRRQADPGLVEAVRGNVYNTRVYPVPPHGARTIRLGYVTPLLFGANASATLELAMPPEHLDERTMSISVQKLNAPAPSIEGLAGAQLTLTTHEWNVSTKERDLTPTQSVRVTLPELPESFVILERDAQQDTWLCASTITRPAAADAPLPALSSLTVLWDASGSRANMSHDKELDLLEAYASAPLVNKITLVVFADRVREVCTFASAKELLTHLAHLNYDGATNLVELSGADALRDACAGIAHGAACVLFSDGMDTLSQDTFSLPKGCSCLAITSGTQRDAEALRQGCRGPVLGLEEAPSNAEALVRLLLGTTGFGVSDISGHGLADVCDVSAPNGSRRTVIARLTGDEATIKIGAQASELTLKAADAQEHSVLSRAWAARRITLLSPRPDENADELLRLGKRFGMASPATSLLVLETLDQWERYEIEPPKSLPEIHDAWQRSMAGRMDHWQEGLYARSHLRRLESLWRKLMQWWENPLPKESHASGRRMRSAPPLRHPRMAAPYFEALLSDSDSNSDSDLSRLSNPSMLDATCAPPIMSAARSVENASVVHKSGPSMRVSVNAWKPNAPYLKALDKAAKDNPQSARDAYFKQRAKYAASPAFFLDCAGWFMTHDDTDFGVSVLTNLAEMRIEDAALLRVMAWRLREAGKLTMALVALRRVLALRSEDSQSFRDLALVLSELAREAYVDKSEEAARAYAEESGELYRTCALTPWDRRPMAIGLFAVEEYNVLRAWAKTQSWQTEPDLPSLGENLEGVPDCDLRITLAWDADETDVDIHVTEPSGEEAYYGHRLTSSGGRVSEDITDGYGPELYEIRHANPGTYLIRAHYFASHQQTVFGPATCTLTVYSDWGRSNQTQTITSVRLEQAHEMMNVGTASYGTASQQEEGAPAPRGVSDIKLGMKVGDVIDIMGDDFEISSTRHHDSCIWDLPNGHHIKVVFDGDEVMKVLEQMPWGQDTILLM